MTSSDDHLYTERGRRALERQADYQRQKSEDLQRDAETISHTCFIAVQNLRQRLERYRKISTEDKLIEVGSGAHGHVFWFGCKTSVGVDPLAVDYKRLFPAWQTSAPTVAAFGENLPFASHTFDLVISDNVIDHAARPLGVLDEIVRILKPGGLLYFTVNVHHKLYDLASRAHGMWNAAGLKVELSAFADHTVHFTESQIRDAVRKMPLDILDESSTVSEMRRRQRRSIGLHPDSILKAAFFKNANYELIATRR